MNFWKGTSFGYGRRIGVVHHFRDLFGVSAAARFGMPAVQFETPPTVELVKEVGRVPGVAFLVVPPCTFYSHFGAALWTIPVPTVAVDVPLNVSDGAAILVDFDNGHVMASESADEVRVLEALIVPSEGSGDPVTSSASGAGACPGLCVLGEAACAADIAVSLAGGADGLSVVKAEQLFDERGVAFGDTAGFVSAVNSRPSLLPLPVRFFDHELSTGLAGGACREAQKYLGYRGVRMLEVDPGLLNGFVDGLDNCGLGDVIVVLPMVTLPAEVVRFRSRLPADRWRVGVSVETPAAALQIKDLLDVADWVEIGLNDLTQYTMGWDRDVPNGDRLPPHRIAGPVADLIAAVAAASRSAGTMCTLGLDLRPHPVIADQIRGLGVQSLSCAPPLVARWKGVCGSEAGRAGAGGVV